MNEVRNIPLQAITPDPSQPRKDFSQEAIMELAQSIRRNGLLQPITIKPVPQDGYVIIAGERRYRAVSALEWETIPAIVYEGKSAKELQLVENINRVDLNPMETAEAYQAYLNDGHNLLELSEVTGKAQSSLSLSLSLLKCRPEVQHLIRRNQFSPAVGTYLSKLSDNGQMTALKAMQSNQLSVAECHKVCEQISAKENQIDMFPEEPVLSAKEIEVREKISNAFKQASLAFQQIANIENDNPGITTQAIADHLDITKEKVEMLQKLVTQFRNSLEYRRVKALC